MESRCHERTQMSVSHILEGNKDKLNMKVSDQTRSQDPHRVPHWDLSYVGLCPLWEIIWDLISTIHSLAKENIVRVLNCPNLDLLGEVILRSLSFKRSPERDHFKRSQFSPSHFERDPNDKSQFCRSHPPKRGQYERSQLSQSGSLTLRECYTNPNPCFGPNLPSRPC